MVCESGPNNVSKPFATLAGPMRGLRRPGRVSGSMLDDRIVLITGASRGIGAATAQMLARHGAAVAVNYATNGAAAMRVVADIAAAGGRALAVQADVRVGAEVDAMLESVRERLGPVGSLVLNAHISAPVGAFAQQSWEDFEARVTGEMRATYHCVKAIHPQMLERRDGRVVAIASGVSQYPPPGAGGRPGRELVSALRSPRSARVLLFA